MTSRRSRLIAVLVVLCGLLALTGCTSANAKPAAPTPSIRLIAPGTTPHTLALKTLKTTTINSKTKFTKAPLTGDLKTIAQQLVGQPVPVQIRRLAVSGSFASGSHVVVAVVVNGGKAHDVDFILTSPNGTRWEKFIKPNLSSNIAAATLILPKITAGQWVIGVEDESGITLDSTGNATGKDLLGLATYNVD